jgi:GWxTD domain-containing protein
MSSDSGAPTHRQRTSWPAGGADRRQSRLLLLCWIALTAAVSACTRQATTGEIDFADGLEQLALGDTAQALALFEKARWELGDDDRVLFHIGRLQAQSSRIDERVRAREILQQAIDRAPEAAVYRETLGELLQRQRYATASTQMLREAVRLDPNASHAWFLLGQNLHRQYFEYMDRRAELDSAMNCYAQALSVDPDETGAVYNLAFLNFHLGFLDMARNLLVPVVTTRACPGRFGMLLAAVEFRARRVERANEVAARTMRCMGWSERERWVGLQSILLPDSTGWWADRSWAQQDSLAHWFWWSVDPTPTTLVNERFLEHITRVVESDFYFEVPHLGKSGDRTDRGEIWLRYGEPRIQMRLYGRDRPVWRWIYGAERGRDRGAFFDFADVYHNDDYQRVRRRAGSDFAVPQVFEVVPAATRLEFPSPPGGMDYQMRYFRGAPGRTAVEIAFAVQPDSDWDGLALEAAGWRGPEDRAAYHRSFLSQPQMYPLADGRLLGRLRFEVPAEALVLGLQAQPERRTAGLLSVPARPWVAMGRDTLDVEDLQAPELSISDVILAYDIRETAGGGAFDFDGLQVMPRVDARIESSELNLYFEIYPSRDILQHPRAIAVRTGVRARPPESFGFWNQFKPGARRRWDPDRMPVVEASYDFVPHRAIEQQALHIDLSVLERGPYELRVELEDATTGEWAGRVIPFLLTPN